jgi:hypothetical protein
MWGPSGDSGRESGSPAVRQMVFVAHHVTGVRLIPQAWLEGFRPSGFREATPREIAGWYEDRDLPLPVEPGASELPGATDAAPGPGA